MIMKHLKRLSTLCLLLMAAMATWAQGDVTAEWNFKENLPAGISGTDATTNYQGVEVDMPSTVEGIVMHVDARNGKLYCVDRDNAQMNPGTILQVPVKSTKDIVTVSGYPGYNHYAIGGVPATEDVTEHRATTAEVAQGYVEVTATEGNNYIYGVKVLQVSMIQEKPLYSTDFSEWTAAKAATSPSTKEVSTKYSHEKLTFTLYNTAVMSVTDSKFAASTTLPHMALQAQKAADPYIMTSKLASVSSVRFIHGATGGNRGWKLEAKGDGDADWVVISDAVANPAAWSEVNAKVNRTNVELRFTNLNASQNAYMFELDINGLVDMSKTPALGSFAVNGESYQAADIFAEQNDGSQAATIEISKQATLISETNPLTDLVADNGDITSVAYETTGEGAAQQTVATIKVEANGEEMIYKATFVFKPDFTLTYIDIDGTKKLFTQQVEKDAPIAELKKYESELPTSMQFRGWFTNPKGSKNHKYTVDDVVTRNFNLYAIATQKEVISADARYDYQLNDGGCFYIEDHEAISSEGSGTYHDAQHGWVFGNGDKLKLLMSSKGYVKMSLCQYSGSGKIVLTDNTGKEMGSVTAKAGTDGASTILNFEGAEGEYTLSFDGTTYLHDLSIVNMQESPFTQNGQWFTVKAGDVKSLLTTLEIVNAQNSATTAERAFIFLPNGTYDLGNRSLTPISGHNISLIGQSMDNVLIVNESEQEGIGVTATFLVTGRNLYMQDLTLKNALDYFNSTTAGRAVCLQDKGARTICKNVKMLSYQDTYYSNANAQFYWETSEIHGVVDYLCGGGDVFFNKCLFVNESRSKTPNSGDVTIAAPYIESSNKFGYVMDHCTIETLSKSFNFGRAWGGVARLAYLNTTINQPSKIASKRFTEGGMNVAADKFVEYNSVDPQGNVVSPKSNVLKFTKDKTVNEYETILTAEQAAEYALDKVFTNWKPAEDAAQVAAPAATYNNGTVTWTAVDGAQAYAIFRNGEFVEMTTGTTYNINIDAEKEGLSIRSANQMGGFGPAAVVSGTNGISAVKVADGQQVIYNLQGQRLHNAGRGLFIINGKKVAIK